MPDKQDSRPMVAATLAAALLQRADTNLPLSEREAYAVNLFRRILERLVDGT